MKTTLNQIREKSPCRSGWVKLLACLGKTKADDDPLDIATVLASNGIEDALWCLRAVQGRDKEIRLYAVWCARQVQHMMTDPRSLAALDVAERFAIGEATKADLAAAEAAAGDAAGDAARIAAGIATGIAAGIATGIAAGIATGIAADSAERAMAVATAWAAEDSAAWEASWAAACAAQANRLRELCAECESGVTQ